MEIIDMYSISNNGLYIFLKNNKNGKDWSQSIEINEGEIV
jgi:hypothetical protein